MQGDVLFYFYSQLCAKKVSQKNNNCDSILSCPGFLDKNYTMATKN
jgi:hypothetical protein